MYPLNLTKPAKTAGESTGFAVANDEAEHQALTEAGFEPAWAAPEAAPEADASGHTLESARAALDAAGVAYDKRAGLAKLLKLLPAAA